MRIPPLGISAKFASLVALSCVGVIIVGAFTASTLRDNLLTDREVKTREMVQVAYSLVAHYGQLAQTGALTQAQAQQQAAAAVEQLHYADDGYFFITDMQPRLVMHPLRKDLMDKDLAGFTDARGSHVYSDLVHIAQTGGGFDSFWFSKPGAPVSQSFPKIAYAQAYAPWGWVICTGIYVDDVDRIFWAQAQSLGMTIAGLTLVMALLSAMLAGSVIRPIHAVVATMRRLAAGEIHVAVPGLGRRDEIGAMASAVLVFKDSLTETERLRAAQQQEHTQAAAEKEAALVSMADRIETETTTVLHEVGARTAAMTATAEEMSASAARTGDSAQSATTASGQALSNAQTVASAAEQLSASIREIGAQVAQSTEVIGRAVDAGGETRAKIQTLNDQVERIGSVSEMITAIAAKTNLLALNATIEAARAGDAGKGFAVVASEVKALASQTAHSTTEIGQHIAQVRFATEASVAAVARIEQTIREISAIAGSIAAAIEQQSAATAEIARNVSETASAANLMNARTQEVTSEATQTSQHAAEVRENAVALNAAVRELRHSVIRVVRTSTAEVDRRHNVRQKLDLPGSLNVAGRAACVVRLTDLSEGGASFRGGPPLDQGARGTLLPDGLGIAIPFRVCSREDDLSHVTFELDGAALTMVRSFTERLAPGRTG